MADDDDAKVAAQARTRAQVVEILREDRGGFFDTLGFNVRSDAGLEKLKRNLNAFDTLGVDVSDREKMAKLERVFAWMLAGYDASMTRNKRLMTAITWSIGTVGGAITLVKFYLDWKHP